MNYLICATGRARSGVLASYLRKIGVGAPDEFYEHARFDLYKLHDEAEIKAYLEEYRINDILGMKLVWSHVYRIYDSLELKLKEFIDRYIPEPQYIFMTRDPMKQAIESVMYGIRKNELPFTTDNFDMDTARKRIWRTVIGNHAWELFFRKERITPIRVNAEALEENPAPVLQNLLEALNVDLPIPDIKNTFRDSLMNDFRDKMYTILLRRHKLMMPDIKIEEYL